MAEIRDVAEVVGMLSAAFPNFTPSEQTYEIYYQTLKDIPADELRAAALHSVSEAGRKFAPSVGELRGAVMELRGYSANVPSSFEAWREVLQQVSNVGYYGTPQFSNPMVERAVKALGWREICMSENQIADRARFVQCYEQLLERAQTQEMLLPEVRGYLEVNGAKLLAPADQIHLLAERMSK
jgi:hypothetical protein